MVKLKEREANFQYDTQKRQHLESELERLPLDYSQCTLALLDAAFHCIVADVRGEACTPHTAAELAQLRLRDSLAAIDDGVPDLNDLRAVAQAVRTIADQLALHAQICPLAAAASCEAYDVALERLRVACAPDALPAADAVDNLQAKGMVAALFPGHICGGLEVALRAYESCLALEVEQGDGEAEFRRLRELASTAASQCALPVACHYLERLAAVQRKALQGASVTAEVHVGLDPGEQVTWARWLRMVQQRGTLLLQHVAFLNDPAAVCAQAGLALSEVEAVLNLPFCLDHRPGHDASPRAEMLACLDAMAAQVRESLSAVAELLPEPLQASAEASLVQRCVDDVTAWLQLVDSVVDDCAALQEARRSVKAGRPKQHTDMLRATMRALQVAAGKLRAALEIPQVKELLLRIDEKHAGLTVDLAEALGADEDSAEVAQLLEGQLKQLMSGEDALTEAMLATKLPPGEGDTGRRLQLAKARQALLFGLRCSSAWCTAERWDSASAIITDVAQYLVHQGHQSVEWRSDSLSTLEATVLSSMAWMQLARAQQAQGHHMAFFNTLSEKVLPQLTAELSAQEEAVFAAAASGGGHGALLAAAVWHCGQDLARGALESLARRTMNTYDVRQLEASYAQLAPQVDALGAWRGRAQQLADLHDAWQAWHGTDPGSQSAPMSPPTEGPPPFSLATSTAFLWKLPAAPQECTCAAAQPAFLAGLVKCRAAQATLAKSHGRVPAQDTRQAMPALPECDTSALQEGHRQLWGAASALVSSFAEPPAGGTAEDWPFPLWGFECLALAVTFGMAVQAASWDDILRLATAGLSMANTDTVQGSARLQLAVGQLHLAAVRGLSRVKGPGEALGFASDTAQRLEVLTQAAMQALHDQEDGGAGDADLAKAGRLACHLQALHIAALADLAHLHALTVDEAGSGNPVGAALQQCTRFVDKYCPYAGVTAAYPHAAFFGFPLLPWAGGFQCLSSHIECLFQYFLRGLWQCAETLAPGVDFMRSPAAHVSPQPFLRGKQEHIFSLEGRTLSGACTPYLSAKAPYADLVSEPESRQAQGFEEAVLQVVGILHKAGLWLGTQPFAGEVASANAHHYNLFFAEGNAFQLCGNVPGMLRSQRKAVASARLLLDAAWPEDMDPATLQPGETPAQVVAAMEVVAQALDEMGLALLASGLNTDALDTFNESMQLKLDLYDASGGASPQAASAANGKYVWVTLSGVIEAALKVKQADEARSAAETQLWATQECAGQGADTLWTALSAFNLARAQAVAEDLTSAIAGMRRALEIAESAEAVQGDTCWYLADGSVCESEPVAWGPPPALFGPYFPPAFVDQAGACRALAAQCRWHLAELYHSTFDLKRASEAFQCVLRGCTTDTADGAVAAADLHCGHSGVLCKMEDQDAAMAAMQSALELREAWQGQLCPQHTALCCGIAVHFLTFVSDAQTAIDFVSQHLSLIVAALDHLDAFLGPDELEDDEVLPEPEPADDASSVSSSGSTSDTQTRAVADRGAAKSLAHGLLGQSALAAVMEGDEDASDSDEDGGSTASGSESGDSKRASRGMTACALMEALRPPGHVQHTAAEVLRVQADAEEALAALLWQVGADSLRTADRSMLQTCRLALLRQASQLWYTLGVAVAQAGGLPAPPGPLQQLHEVSFQPTPPGESAQVPSGGQEAGQPEAAQATSMTLACLAAAVQAELQVQQGTIAEEYCSQRTLVCALVRAAHLLFSAVGEAAIARDVAQLASNLLRRSPALRAATSRDVSPASHAVAADVLMHLGSMSEAKAVVRHSLEALKEARDSIDTRDGVDIVQAMQPMSVLSQMEAMLLMHLARMLEVDEPDACLLTLKAAKGLLEEYVSPATPHPARLFPWDQRIVALTTELGRKYEEMGDAVNALHFRRVAAVLCEQRDVEDEDIAWAPTAAERAAARAGVW